MASLWRALRGRAEPEVSRLTLSQYFGQVAEWFRYGGGVYGAGQHQVTTTYGDRPAEPIGNSFEGYAQGLLFQSAPVASVQDVRLRVFAQAPLLFQRRADGRPGDLYDDASLDILRRPWTGGTTSDLQRRALLYADLGGNAYVVHIEDELVVLRPDWVQILLAKRMHQGVQVGWKQAGIAYYEGGLGVGDPAVFIPGEYSHFAPKVDPLANYRGMSWLTPVVREIMADKSATDHKLAFFEHAATPNIAVSLPKEVTPEQFEAFVDAMNARHQGVENAYKTLYTGGGADVTVIGADMRQIDFKITQGAGETRVANAGGVHPVLVGLSEGMQGSSLNAGNYSAAKRSTVDTTFRDLWQNWAGSLETLFPPADGDRLWYDARDIPFLSEDQKDAAEIQHTKAVTINGLITAGFDPDSAVAAVDADDRKLLRHTGLVSVQLLPPGSGPGDTTQRAADDQQLHHYWTRGEGLAKWVSSPHPWTSLYDHLVKYVGPQRAKRMASEWFHEVFGIWPGERKGDNPAGPG